MNKVIEQYYACFNSANYDGMLSLLTDDVLHEPSQGLPRQGIELFTEFLTHMERCYKEQISELVVFANAEGNRAAAEFMLNGTYLNTDTDFPAARGQAYQLRVGAFFELENDKISRVSNHYNLQSWLEQISR